MRCRVQTGIDDAVMGCVLRSRHPILYVLVTHDPGLFSMHICRIAAGEGLPAGVVDVYPHVAALERRLMGVCVCWVTEGAIETVALDANVPEAVGFLHAAWSSHCIIRNKSPLQI